MTLLSETDTAEMLRERAELFRAEMIVMGAYGHSQLREAFLGSIPRSPIKCSSVQNPLRSAVPSDADAPHKDVLELHQ